MFLGHTELALINRELARWYGIRVSATYGRGLQVFSATDEDGIPILCLVVKEYQRLSAFRLSRRKISEELSSHASLDMAWSLEAASAAPIIALHPRSPSLPLLGP